MTPASGNRTLHPVGSSILAAPAAVEAAAAADSPASVAVESPASAAVKSPVSVKDGNVAAALVAPAAASETRHGSGVASALVLGGCAFGLVLAAVLLSRRSARSRRTHSGTSSRAAAGSAGDPKLSAGDGAGSNAWPYLL
eukprot:scaffold21785_cov103-Isochrysis_galbana.AAC.2